MMIDFALEAERNEGLPPEKSIYQACLLRFRPIMMTTMAALLGALPLALENGTGSELRRPLGIAIVGGLLLSQFLTLYTTPVIYLYLDRLGALGPSAGAKLPDCAWPAAGRCCTDARRRDLDAGMNISEPFIRRPVGTSLLAIGLFLAGHRGLSLSAGGADSARGFSDDLASRPRCRAPIRPRWPPPWRRRWNGGWARLPA